MSNPLPRIFISSVMPPEYRLIRDAAARGIARAGCEPIRAEDFPAAHVKPRNACLDAVASCDGVVLILGASNGNITETGYSATEDEYREAVRLRKRIYVFLERVRRDERQEEFVRSITGYIDDNWRKTFSTPDELEKLVEDALRKDGVLGMSADAEQKAAARLEAAFHKRPRDATGLTLLHIIWTTLRDEVVVPPTRLRSEEFQESIQMLAHTGKTRLFTYEEAKEVQTTSSFLHITQGKSWNGRGGADTVVLDLFTEGTLSVLLNVTGLTDRDPHDLMSSLMNYIDPDDVRTRLQQAWGFARALWHSLDEYERHSQLLYNAALHNIGHRRFQKAPQGRGRNSFVYPRMQDPGSVFVYDRPRLIARSDLENSEAETDEIMAMLQIRFDELSKY